MKRLILTVIVATILGSGLLFTAYHIDAGSNQRNWTLSYDKGTYAGPASTPLSEETLADLRARMVYQAGPAIEGVGFASSSVGSVGRNVRPPESAVVPADADARRSR